eukprot:scaffold897_cov402-Prasinococcus_capsulatus_cf.AAC.72
MALNRVPDLLIESSDSQSRSVRNDAHATGRERVTKYPPLRHARVTEQPCRHGSSPSSAAVLPASKRMRLCTLDPSCPAVPEAAHLP